MENVGSVARRAHRKAAAVAPAHRARLPAHADLTAVHSIPIRSFLEEDEAFAAARAVALKGARRLFDLAVLSLTRLGARKVFEACVTDDGTPERPLSVAKLEDDHLLGDFRVAAAFARGGCLELVGEERGFHGALVRALPQAFCALSVRRLDPTREEDSAHLLGAVRRDFGEFRVLWRRQRRRRSRGCSLRRLRSGGGSSGRSGRSSSSSNNSASWLFVFVVEQPRRRHGGRVSEHADEIVVSDQPVVVRVVRFDQAHNVFGREARDVEPAQRPVQFGGAQRAIVVGVKGGECFKTREPTELQRLHHHHRERPQREREPFRFSGEQGLQRRVLRPSRQAAPGSDDGGKEALSCHGRCASETAHERTEPSLDKMHIPIEKAPERVNLCALKLAGARCRHRFSRDLTPAPGRIQDDAAVARGSGSFSRESW
mmetsp:Transcript_8184/g.27173  ORF Transcript_8184/g.27173 Transcript_8184/m.27173 type:complete len:429 (-) Transcript_8184:11942-13228(-)